MKGRGEGLDLKVIWRSGSGLRFEVLGLGAEGMRL